MSEPTRAPLTGLKGVLLRLASVLLGMFVGAFVNMGMLMLGGRLVPAPAGVDMSDAASINAHVASYSVAQLLVPFVAHALGTLVGAFVAARVALGAGRELQAAMVVGGIFLFGGIGAMRMIPAAPAWFDALDLVVAYLPMAFLGLLLARATARSRG